MTRFMYMILAASLLLSMVGGVSAVEKLPGAADQTMVPAASWTTYDWNASSGAQGASRFEITHGEQGDELHISSVLPNDARYVRELAVTPNTVYRFTCLVRTENIGLSNRGASISISGLMEGSADIKGTHGDWARLDFYGKTGADQKKLSFTVGLGGYGSLNNGSVWFKEVRVEKAENNLPLNVQIAALTAPTEAAVPQERHGGTAIAGIGGCGVLLVVWGLAIRRRGARVDIAENFESAPMTPSRSVTDRTDFMIMGALTLFSLVVALFNLGGHSAPETGWQAAAAGDSVTIELGREVDLERFYYYSGINARSSDGSRFTLSARTADGAFVPVLTFAKENGPIWKFAAISVRTNSLRLTADTPGGRLNEIAVVEKGTTTALTGLHIAETPTVPAQSGKPENLVDEQSAFEYAPSFRTGFYFDEIYHARTAWESLHQIEPYETTHPPLGKLLISSGIAIFGMNAFGWRVVGALFGVALVPLMYLFGLKLFRNRFYAFCSAFLMMADFMRFTQSRVAVIDVYGVFFILLMYYFILDLFTEPGEPPPRSTNATLVLVGVAFGIGAACKWIVVYAGGGIGLAVLLKTVQDLRQRQFLPAQQPVGFLLQRFSICLLAFVLIPSLIYLLSYIPFLNLPGRGHELMDVLRIQKHMYNYHKTLQATHPFSSPWWSWPLDMRPMWMYTGSGLPAGTVSTIASFGNPAIWWLSIPAIVSTAYFAVIKRDMRIGLILLAFTFQYLPWVGINRLVFIYHFFSAVPFVILCIVATLKNCELRFPDARTLIQLYLAVTGALFVLFYPALSGLPVSKGYIAGLRWLPTWLF